MKVVAVVPIRKGSQRVKNKNLRPFADSTLLEVKIESLLSVGEIDEIIVNTNSDEAIEIVNGTFSGERVRTQRRSEYFASSACSGSEFFKHLGDVTETEIFVYAPCTSPFVKAETISQCIKMYDENCRAGDYDCVSTVSSVKQFLWQNGTALNYDPKNAPNSQDLPEIVALNFGVTVTSREDVIKNCNIIGKHPFFVKTSDIESVDIDTPLDFYIAEQMYKKLKANEPLIVN
jgi:N-acylneuraminate cytidylyltransferase